MKILKIERSREKEDGKLKIEERKIIIKLMKDEVKRRKRKVGKKEILENIERKRSIRKIEKVMKMIKNMIELFMRKRKRIGIEKEKSKFGSIIDKRK